MRRCDGRSGDARGSRQRGVLPRERRVADRRRARAQGRRGRRQPVAPIALPRPLVRAAQALVWNRALQAAMPRFARVSLLAPEPDRQRRVLVRHDEVQTRLPQAASKTSTRHPEERRASTTGWSSWRVSRRRYYPGCFSGRPGLSRGPVSVIALLAGPFVLALWLRVSRPATSARRLGSRVRDDDFGSVGAHWALETRWTPVPDRSQGVAFGALVAGRDIRGVPPEEPSAAWWGRSAVLSAVAVYALTSLVGTLARYVLEERLGHLLVAAPLRSLQCEAT